MRMRTLSACSAVAAVIVACGGAVGDQDADGGSTVAPAPSGVGAAGDRPADAGDGTTSADASADADDAASPGDGRAPDASLPDDPCPPKLDINCSTTCGGSAGCSVAKCKATSAIPVPDDDFPFVVRAPASPGLLTNSYRCDESCGGGTAGFYGLSFRIFTAHQEPVRVRVEPPWWVVNQHSTDDACGLEHHSCQFMGPRGDLSIPVVVGTEDPNAPARNVVIEATTAPCPGDGS